MSSKTPDYKKLAPKYGEMFQRIDKMQWEIGRSLHEDGIISDGGRQRLGDLIGVSPKTLKTYYQVYVNFNERFPDGRPENIKHGVLESLQILASEELYDEFFAKYERPTKAMAEAFVRSKKPPVEGIPRSRETTTLSVGGVTLKISADAEGPGEIMILGATKVAAPVASLQDNAWRIEFLA